MANLPDLRRINALEADTPPGHIQRVAVDDPGWTAQRSGGHIMARRLKVPGFTRRGLSHQDNQGGRQRGGARHYGTQHGTNS